MAYKAHGTNVEVNSLSLRVRVGMPHTRIGIGRLMKCSCISTASPIVSPAGIRVSLIVACVAGASSVTRTARTISSFCNPRLRRLRSTGKQGQQNRLERGFCRKALTLEDARSIVHEQSSSRAALPVVDFLQKRDQWRVNGCLPKVFDVRSPGEYAQGHIPGSLSLPLLSNLDRADVGTLYKRTGRSEAFELALSRAHPRLGTLLQSVHEACDNTQTTSQGLPNPHVLVYCMRGGLRSLSVARFLGHYGYDAITLEHGYKGYRKWANSTFERPQRICIIGGATGSGKTEVLAELRTAGLQVIDLEALARHKGSVFGHLGELPQPTSEQMRNLLAEEWACLDPEHFVYIEDEGSRIGDVCLPATLYHRMRQAQLVINLDVPFELRLQRSLALYGSFGVEALSKAVGRFKKRMGMAQTQVLLDHLSKGELQPVCRVALENYDRHYRYHLHKGRNPCVIKTVAVSSLDAGVTTNAVQSVSQPMEQQVPVVSALYTDSQMEEPERITHKATCFCGAVHIQVQGEPLNVSVCHCSICRRLTGAPFVISALFESANVEIMGTNCSKAEIHELQTSRAVTRKRCAKCFAPIAADLGKQNVALPVGLFEWEEGRSPDTWKPRLHLHYGSRVIDVDDGVVKYLGRRNGPLWDQPQEAASID